MKIYKLDDTGERSDLLFNEEKSQEDLGEDSILRLNFQAILGTQFEVVVDEQSYGVYTVN
ncbi:MAG: hypothetical protein Q4D88_06720 [Anaerococcus sp.]|nr:hypothetical protein [Anaerococcus sp.]